MEGDFMKKRIYLLMLTALIGLSCCACGQDDTLQAELSSLPGVSLQLEDIEPQPAEQDDSTSTESSQAAAPTSQAEAETSAAPEQPACRVQNAVCLIHRNRGKIQSPCFCFNAKQHIFCSGTGAADSSSAVFRTCPSETAGNSPRIRTGRNRGTFSAGTAPAAQVRL